MTDHTPEALLDRLTIAARNANWGAFEAAEEQLRAAIEKRGESLTPEAIERLAEEAGFQVVRGQIVPAGFYSYEFGIRNELGAFAELVRALSINSAPPADGLTFDGDPAWKAYTQRLADEVLAGFVPTACATCSLVTDGACGEDCEREASTKDAVEPMRRADGWISTDGGLSWRNPAPDASAPMVPIGQTITVQAGLMPNAVAGGVATAQATQPRSDHEREAYAIGYHLDKMRAMGLADGAVSKWAYDRRGQALDEARAEADKLRAELAAAQADQAAGDPHPLQQGLRELFLRCEGWVPFEHAAWFSMQRDAIMRALAARPAPSASADRMSQSLTVSFDVKRVDCTPEEMAAELAPVIEKSLRNIAATPLDDFMRDALKRCLKDLMSAISEDCWCAGWMMGNEFALWEMVADPSHPRAYGMSEVPEEQVAELRELSKRLGGWVVWWDDHYEPTLPAAEWGARFLTLAEWAPWLERHKAQLTNLEAAFVTRTEGNGNV